MREEREKRRSTFGFEATGIGSVPFLNIQQTCRKILEQLPQIPYWPQFVRRSHLEDMSIQASEGLPLLEVMENKRSLRLSSKEREAGLVSFYDHFLAEDLDYFAVSRGFAPGLYEQVQVIREAPERYGPFLKGQSVGPITFAAGITDNQGKSILFDLELREAMVKGLSIKALCQIRELSKSGKRPILFLDEPALSGFGSAFSPIERHEVIELLKEVIDYLRQRSDSLIGVHCCGNTDWPMIMESGPDIVSFDAFGYMDYFLLYRDEITRFLKDGGVIAWGIVPTASFSGSESVEDLYSRLEEGLKRLHEWGIDQEIVTGGSILTPACGMGTMEESTAERALDLLSTLSKRCSESLTP